MIALLLTQTHGGLLKVIKVANGSSEEKSVDNLSASSSSESSSSNGDSRTSPPPLLIKRVVPTAELSTPSVETPTSAITTADSLLIHSSGLAGLFADPMDAEPILVANPQPGQPSPHSVAASHTVGSFKSSSQSEKHKANSVAIEGRRAAKRRIRKRKRKRSFKVDNC